MAGRGEQPEPFSPTDALAAFQHDPTVRVELVASEPLVFDPIALCFDARGRMFVIENCGYPTDAEPPLGKIVLLEDADADGVMDKRTVFAEGFDFPSGIMPWRDGLLVICAPNVLHLKDTDGDNVADSREVLLTGFSTGGSTQLRSSHPTLALDGWIYFTNGLSGGEVRHPEDSPEKAVKMGKMDLRWNPWDGRIETVTGQAQYGQAFDEYGNRFICSNRKHIEQVMFQPGDLARNPFLPQTTLTADIPDHGAAAKTFPISSNVTTAYSHEGTFTAACGLVVYRGNALGPDFQGNSFVCDPTGNLVHRDILDYGGAACTARRAYEGREFLASTDNWFRPVFLANAPDGALYVCDMYRKTIEHPVYLPPEVAARTDFVSGRDMGRIYRVVARDSAAPRQHDFPNKEILLPELANSNAWNSDTAFRLLLEADALPERKLRGWYNTTKDSGRDKAIMLLGSRSELDPEDLSSALSSDSEKLQLAALRHCNAVNLSTNRVRTLLKSSSPHVRLMAALLAGIYPGNGEPARRSTTTLADGLGKELAELVWDNRHDPWLVTAGLSSGSPDSKAFIRTLLDSVSTSPERNSPELIRLGETLGAMAGGLNTSGAVSAIAGGTRHAPDLWQLRTLAAFLKSRPHDTLGPAGAALDQLNQSGLTSTCLSLATDTGADIQMREAAVELLGYADFAEAEGALAAALKPGTPDALQRAAVGAIGTNKSLLAASLLVNPETWQGLSGSARAQARGTVLAHRETALQLLQHIDSGSISAYTLDPTMREQLAKYKDKEIAQLASRLFSSLSGADRTKTYEDLRDLLALSPDASRGHVVYAEQCAQCHVFQGEGHAVGPELSDMRLQKADYILLHVIDPNKAVTAGFESYTVNTASLETHVGILATENEAAITLRQALGIEVSIPRAEIISITTENRSLMPEELKKVLSKQQLRDLIGFLRGE